MSRGRGGIWTSPAREHLADVKRKLTALSALLRELDALIGECRRGTVAECRILEALVPRK
jgi:hypothetical protein